MTPSLQRPIRAPERRADRLLVALLLPFALSLILLLFGIVRSDAADPPGADPCLDNLPVAKPRPGSHRVVQLVNCSNQVLLGAADKAFRAGQPATPVLPREKTWVMQPFDPAEPYKQNGPNGNVLTIDIPQEWENTAPAGSTGPRFWARTGCRYDEVSDRAQCETGGCGGYYDCSKAGQNDFGATTLSEWTFYQPMSNQGISFFQDNLDISVVDGANLTMDIEPVGGTPHNPTDALGGHDIHWLAEQYPLANHGQDLRATCIPSFQLKRSDMTSGILGFVIIGNDGKPVGGDYAVACFSNCGKYKFVVTPNSGCDPHNPNYQTCEQLYNTFCLALPAPNPYGDTCSTDKDCYLNTQNYGISCFKNTSPNQAQGICAGRGFIAGKTCSADVCTYPYGYVDPVTKAVFYSTQPPFDQCSDVTNDAAACIGDDTIHSVMPKAYSWPNDPQVYDDDSPLYRVIFSPGGNPSTPPITPAGPIPACSELPEIYEYPSNLKYCAQFVDTSTFALAYPTTPANPHWGCALPPGVSGDNAVICRWKTPPGRGRSRR